MCIGVPSEVVAIDGEMAEVECLGRQRTVSLLLMPEPVKIGDYLLIQVGDFAVEKIEPQRARDALEYIRQLDRGVENRADEDRVVEDRPAEASAKAESSSRKTPLARKVADTEIAAAEDPQ